MLDKSTRLKSLRGIEVIYPFNNFFSCINIFNELIKHTGAARLQVVRRVVSKVCIFLPAASELKADQ